MTTTRAAAVQLATPNCAQTVNTMSLNDKLGQLLMIGVEPPTAAQALALVRDDHVGGLFIGSTDTSLLTGGAIGKARSAAALPLFVGIDEEGGRVQRVIGPHGPLPSARTMASTLSPVQVQTLAVSLGEELRKLGVNVDLAPDADVSDQPANAVIGDRSFSDSPNTVTAYAGAFAAGLRATGVLPVLKHFPGHGHATGDSHTGPAVTPPLSSLLNDDLVPYRSLPETGVTAVMVGHLEVPGLTGTVPASLSPAAYTLLRDTFHFNGVATTDDLGAMTAVTANYDLPTAVLLAIQSGADIALWTTGTQVGQVIARLASAVASGQLPRQRVDQAVARVLAAKGACA
jgi:beta-N-acetylhexosaminidase